MTEPQNGPRRVVLHLGAHKTASTHFSEVIYRNLSLARAAGVKVPRKGPLREHVTHVLSGLKDGKPVPQDNARAAQGLAAGAEALLLMDENILGTPRNLFSADGMYPRAARRTGRAARLFDGAQVEIMLALRNPATFIAASWSESLRSDNFRPFRTYLEGVRVEDISWFHIVRDMREAAPGARFTVWRFEDYRALQGRLVAIALGHDPDSPPEFEQIETPVRVGLSQRALEAVSLRARLTGSALPEAEVEEIMARYPKGAAYPPPQPWSAWERDVLTRRYAEDLERIAALADVSVLAP